MVTCARVTLVISSLGAGGAERVLTTMVNYWARNGRDVTVLSLQDADTRPFYRLHPDVHYKPLALLGASNSTISAVVNNVKRLTAIRRSLRSSHSDFVISFLSETNVLTLLASRFAGARVVVTEHTDPTRWPIAPAWSVLRRMTYRWADRIVVLNEFAGEFFRKFGDVEVIPNPIEDCARQAGSSSQQPRENLVVAMGRLGPEKGFDILLHAFSRLGHRIGEWKLVIIGEGVERPRLERLIEELGIREHVTLTGMVREPRHYLRRAGIFVLSSRYEGFPMSLCEAMACGTAIISTEYHDGIHDLVESGRNGLIVPPEDAGALARGMSTLIDQSSLRKRFGENARQICDRYGVEAVMSRWDELIDSSKPGKGKRL